MDGHGHSVSLRLRFARFAAWTACAAPQRRIRITAGARPGAAEGCLRPPSLSSGRPLAEPCKDEGHAVQDHEPLPGVEARRVFGGGPVLFPPASPPPS